ncbi:MAG: hypothetical protein KGZ72_14865 [Roseovarius sp.]|jgi:hypothetical protein|nr:hypothetical protein [Roseovarius sp.]
MADGPLNKKDRKDSQLILRINSKERDDFIALCEALDTSAAREIRAFIRDFVKSHETQTSPPIPALNIPNDIAKAPEKKRKSKQGKKRK